MMYSVFVPSLLSSCSLVGNLRGDRIRIGLHAGPLLLELTLSLVGIPYSLKDKQGPLELYVRDPPS